jgi:hypothetical protein
MASSSPPIEPSQGHFLVATTDEVAYARVVGLGTMNNTLSLKVLLEQLQGKGLQTFVFDLSECSGFDSTFMGVLLSIALGQSEVLVVNSSSKHRKLLEEVGIHRVIKLCDEPLDLPDVTLQKVESSPLDSRSRIRHIVAAHESLVKLDEKNERKFGTFLELLRAELEEDGGS